MTTLVHSPQRDCVSSLGIPVDNLSLQETVDKIITLAKTRDGRSRLVSTLNVDFLVNSLGTGFYRARHPELFNVLRDSDLVTADGFPILWLSRIMGKPLPERVCGSDLVPALAERAHDHDLSFFLLGGGKGAAQAAADTLAQQHPGLRIAGTAAPFIHTNGPDLANCIADDEAIVEQINGSGADILLVGLGNPKQELWFNRNRENLRIPVSIGVGGTFEFITGNVRRAPGWIQRLNLEWAFRITQDPARLWSRYAKGLVKLGLLTTPLVYSRARQSLAFAGRRRAGADDVRWRTIWSSRDQSLDLVRLPALVSADYLRALVRDLAEKPAATTLRLLDFSAVKKVEMAGHQALFSLAEIQQQAPEHLQLLGMTERLRRDLAAARVLDVIIAGEGDALKSLGSEGANRRFNCRSYVLDHSSLIYLGGKVNARNLADVGFIECLQQTARDRDCIIDLRNVSLLESSAIVALRPFLDGRTTAGGRVLFSGASANVRQMFRMAGLGEPAHFISDSELITALCTEGEGHE